MKYPAMFDGKEFTFTEKRLIEHDGAITLSSFDLWYLMCGFAYGIKGVCRPDSANNYGIYRVSMIKECAPYGPYKKKWTTFRPLSIAMSNDYLSSDHDFVVVDVTRGTVAEMDKALGDMFDKLGRELNDAGSKKIIIIDKSLRVGFLGAGATKAKIVAPFGAM